MTDDVPSGGEAHGRSSGGYPAVDGLAFELRDQGDHSGGGHCASLPDEELARWVELLDQHYRAFEILSDGAVGDDDGWAMTRPVLFAAHHTCEVAIKRLLIQQVGAVGAREHCLGELWSRLDGHLPQSLSTADVEWMSGFVAKMGDVTVRGFDGRFPDERNDLAERWCCLNVERLRDCVRQFVALSLAEPAAAP